MKKLYIFLAIALSAFSNLFAQEINVSLNVDSNPNPQISEWVDRAELALLTIVNTNEKYEDSQYKIHTKIYKDGELVVETKTSQMPVMYLPFGSEIFLADEIVPYNALTFYGNIEKTVIQTGLLPAGMYSFCVSLVDLKGNSLTKQESICKPMVITDYQLPELIFPIENTTILAQNLPSTIFTWSPLAPTPPGDEGVKYIIAISEVRDKQSAARAFDVNYPLVEEEIMAGTQFNWPTDIDMPDEDKQYVWSIKPITFNDNPYKSGKNSFVKIGTFTVTNQNRGQTVKGGQNDNNTKSQEIFNCGINPLDLSNELFFMDTGNTHAVDLHGLAVLQNKFWMQVTGAINPAQHQLTTYIDWGCTHAMEFISINDPHKTHDYNNYADNQNSNPTSVTIHLELRSRTTGLSCKIEVSKNLKHSSYNQENDTNQGNDTVFDKQKDVNCNMPDNDFIAPLIFRTGYPSDAAAVHIDHIDTMFENYMTYIGITDLENYDAFIEIDWGFTTTTDEVDRFGESYNYSGDILNGNKEIPTEICLKLIIKKKGSKNTFCEKLVCIPFPNHIKEHLEANWPNEHIVLTPNCENIDKEKLKQIITFLPQVEEKPSLIQVAAFQAMTMTYMAQVLGGIDLTQFMVLTTVDCIVLK